MDRFDRTRMLWGREAMDRLSEATVCVAGAGAVGSFAIEALARSGIGHLRIYDFDKVQASNINRQLYALESSRGRFKCELAEERVLDIHPGCDVRGIRLFINGETAEQVCDPRPDLLIDAIDSLNSKVNLLVAAHRESVPTLSSMGAASRTDPSMIRVGDLFQTRHCPLARFMRKRLRRRGIDHGIPCVYSEEPRRRNLEDSQSQAAPGETPDEADEGRARPTLGSSVCLTGMFGLRLAHEAIRILIEKRTSP